MPRKLQRRINETELTLHIIRTSTPQDVKFNIFSRINQGGLPLTAQEIRNAIYPGVWRQRLRKMAEGKPFLEATERKIKGERMEDIELVLRFVALYTLPASESRHSDQNLDEFLNTTVEDRFPAWSEAKWDEVESAFNRAMLAAPLVFGDMAFRKYYVPGQHRRPINRGLFEAESVAVARRTQQDLDELTKKQSHVVDMFGHYFQNNTDFAAALLYATGKGWASTKRLEIMDKIFDEVLDA